MPDHTATATFPRTGNGPILIPVFTDDVSHESLEIAVDLAEYRDVELVIVGMEAVPEQTSLTHPKLKSIGQQRAKTRSQLAEELAPSPLETTSAVRTGRGVDSMVLQEVVDRGERS